MSSNPTPYQILQSPIRGVVLNQWGLNPFNLPPDKLNTGFMSRYNYGISRSSLYINFLSRLAGLKYVLIFLWLTTPYSVSVVHVGECIVEIKTEADSNDITECMHDGRPSIGMFALFIIYIP